MDAALFLEQFGHLADSPGGVSKLRNLILELAVRGQLLPQNPDDEPASELLKRIETEKKRLVKAGELKPSKPLPPITEDEVPYALPDGWVWTRLGHTVSIIRGVTFPSSAKEYNPNDTNIVCLRTTNIQREVEWNDLIYISREYVSHTDKIVRKRDILISLANSRELVGKTAIVKEIPIPEATLGGFIGAIRPFNIFPEYMNSFLCAPFTRQHFVSEASQTTNIANISAEKLNNTLLPLPPLAEQGRIVAKVDELMALCDQLESELRIRNDLRQQSAKSSLFHLTDTESHLDAHGYWQSIEAHFPKLFDRTATVSDLRATILQLAVQGRLVPQNPDDEPASDLLKRIEAEKKRLIKAGELKPSKALPPITEDEVPYALPDGWTLVYIQPLLSIERHGMKTGPFGSLLKKHEHKDEGVPVFGIENIGTMRFIHGNKIFVTEQKALDLISYEVIPDDILISRSGTVGEVCVVPDGYSRALISTNLMRIALNREAVNSRFFVLLFNGSTHVLNQISELCRGTTREFLNQKILNSIIFPLPPLIEQERIVAKVDELMALCDQLEAAIETGQALSGQLFDSIVKDLFEISIVY